MISKRELRLLWTAGILSLLVMPVFVGCTSTVTPGLIKAPEIPIEKVIKTTDGFDITAEQRAKYNMLIALGYGSEKHHFLPPLQADDGITAGTSTAFHIDRIHAIYFEAMNELYRSGISP